MKRNLLIEFSLQHRIKFLPYVLRKCSRGFFAVHLSQMLSSNLVSWLMAYCKTHNKFLKSQQQKVPPETKDRTPTEIAIYMPTRQIEG